MQKKYYVCLRGLFSIYQMKNKMLRPFCLALVYFLFTAFGSNTNRISLHMEVKRLYNKKVISLKADVYYKYIEGVMVTHYTYPQEYIYISCLKGEVKAYYPQTNEVIIQQNSIFSIENDVLYYFVNNKIFDLGLKELGFTLHHTRYEKSDMITTWHPPAELTKNLLKVEMVHENNLPIYSAYYNRKGKIVKKIYYSGFSNYGHFALPRNITEFEYLAKGDSIISRKTYTNIKTNDEANNSFFDFRIPKEAKIIKKSTLQQ